MAGRWALFVDAGWVFAAGSTSAFAERVKRHEIIWDPAVTVARLVDAARPLVPEHAELLRTYWYDGSPNRLPLGDQHRVAALPDVKLRLGRTAREGQKGVDGLIIHDLITLAYRSMITDAVVVSGDEDLLEAIESAQANGTRVHLLEIPIGGIAAALLNVVDRRAVLAGDVWKELFARAPAAVPDAAAPDVVNPVTQPVAADVGEVANGEPAGVIPPPVSSLTSGPVKRPAWMELPLLPTESDVSPAGVEFAREWVQQASPDEVAELLAARPYLPTVLDGQLLRRGSVNGEWLSDTQRRSLRDAFWTTLSGNGPGRSMTN